MNTVKRVSDISLVREFKKGSLAAFEELVSRYETKVFNLSMRFTRNREDAEEILQDVFATIYRKISSFQGKSAFSSWLYRIVVNSAYMKLRKRKQEQSVHLEDLPVVPQVESPHDYRDRSDFAAMNQQLRTTLQGAIDRLPEQYRAVFVLRDVDGLSNEEVGRMLRLSVPAVKSRLHRSRLMLRKKLQRCYEEVVGDTAMPYEVAA